MEGIDETVTIQNDFQSRSSREGLQARGISESVLISAGFKIIGRNVKDAEKGVTINFELEDKTGGRWYVDTSGSFTSTRAGLGRTDTAYKALGRASVLSLDSKIPVLFMTTNLPGEGTAGDKAMRATAGRTFFDVIVTTDNEDKKKLRHYAKLGKPNKPLLGFWRAENLFGAEVSAPNEYGASLRASLTETGDPLGRLAEADDVEKLSHRIKILLPSVARDGSSIGEGRRDEVFTAIGKVLVEAGGGMITQRAIGYWKSPLGVITSESVEVLEAYMENALPDSMVIAIRDLVLKGLNQESFAMVVGDEMLIFK